MATKLLPSLYERRLEKDLTQAELAEKVGATSAAISVWEKGEAHPEVDTLIRLAKCLDCSPVDLLIGQIQHFVYNGNKKIDPWVSLSIDSLVMSAQKEKPDSRAAYLLLQSALRVVARVRQETEPRKITRRGPRRKKAEA